MVNLKESSVDLVLHAAKITVHSDALFVRERSPKLTKSEKWTHFETIFTSRPYLLEHSCTHHVVEQHLYIK